VKTEGTLVIADQGHFWVGVKRRGTDRGTLPTDAMFVQYQIPAERRHPIPIVMVHGGGGQGLDFLATLDGRPGWATFFLRQGFCVYVVDRPGHGRARNGAAGVAATESPTYESLAEVLFGKDEPAPHTQWPGPRTMASDLADQFCASQGPLAANTVESERAMQSAGAGLLDRIGPTILLTHSLGASFGWLTADARPGMVKAIVAIEPAGPPFGELSNLRRLPVLVVTADASPSSRIDRGTVDFLLLAGVAAEHLRLEEVGIRGNGHLMMLERNSDEIAGRLIDWLTRTLPPSDRLQCLK
jgi:pimeloyl-ACP methyl ester carboxylesterase